MKKNCIIKCAKSIESETKEGNILKCKKQHTFKVSYIFSFKPGREGNINTSLHGVIGPRDLAFLLMLVELWFL